MNGHSSSQVTNRDEEAALWCIDLIEGELDDISVHRFDAWIACPDNAVSLEEALRVWEVTGEAASAREIVSFRMAALSGLHAVQGMERREKQSRFSPMLLSRSWSAMAVAALVALVVTGASLWAIDPTRAYETQIGERRVFALDDGSRLILDAETEVRVRMDENRRELELVRGRARFNVAKDPLRPFSVVAAGNIVVATGTSFSVERINSEVHVLLYEGHVAVLQDGATTSAPRPVVVGPRMVPADQMLVPGKELVTSALASNNVARLYPADVEAASSWEMGMLSFDNERLSDAAERFNRYSSRKISFGDKRTGNLKISGVFSAEDISAFIEGVAVLHDIRVTKNDSNITLTIE